MITLHQTSFFVFLIWFHSGFASSPQQYGSSSVAHCSTNTHDLIVFPTIVGGVRAGESEFRHMAALGFGFPGNWSWLCGGSLISDYYVLTVAHCLRNKNMQVAVVRLGTKNIINPESTYMDYNISQRIPHPSFRGQNYNDIAVLRLSTNVVFTRKIFPACLYVKTDFNDSTLTASGWGGVANAGETSSYLLKVDLVLYNYTFCNKTYGKRPKLPRGIDPSSMICAGGRGYQSKDICHGDSGGPLQISNGSYSYLVGLALNGISCGIPGVPSLYTKVSAYIGWIEDIVWQ